MSIAHFSTQPCPDCKKDTMHYRMKCSVCGHINLTPTEHRMLGQSRLATRRLFARKKYGNYYMNRLGYQEERDRKAMQRETLLARTEEMLTIAQRKNGGLFGAGRGKPKT